VNILVKISRAGDRFRWEQVCQSCGADVPESTARTPCARCGGRLVVDILKVATLPRPRRRPDPSSPSGPTRAAREAETEAELS
jgi:DNA-directed RNA polymerase subunit RPC12/RpoP